jgi:hypothetical protein
MPTLGPPGGGGSPGVFSVGSVIGRIYDMLLGTTREQVAQLSADIGEDDTTCTLGYASVITDGDILSIDDELIYTWGTTSASGGVNATIQRGYRNTEAASHDADALVLVNPYFSTHEVRECLRDEIRSWPPQVFQVNSIDIAAVDFVEGYDLGDINPFLPPYRVSISPDTLTPGTDDMMWPTISFEVDQNANTDAFPSGNALFITAPGGIYQAPQTIHFKYASPFNVDSEFDDTTDLVENVGIDESDIDVAVYGAMWRLVQGFEARRNLFNPMATSSDVQGVPPGSILREADYYKTERNNRLGDAERRLRSLFPVVRR